MNIHIYVDIYIYIYMYICTYVYIYACALFHARALSVSLALSISLSFPPSLHPSRMHIHMYINIEWPQSRCLAASLSLSFTSICSLCSLSLLLFRSLSHALALSSLKHIAFRLLVRALSLRIAPPTHTRTQDADRGDGPKKDNLQIRSCLKLPASKRGARQGQNSSFVRGFFLLSVFGHLFEIQKHSPSALV